MMKHLLLLGICLGFCLSADAQLIYPWRDVVRAMAGNTIPSAVSSKKGYVMISDTLGVWRYHKLETYIEDSLDISGGGGSADGDFLKLDSSSPPEWGDSMKTTSYTLFDGLSGGLQTKIAFLKNGIVETDQDSGLNNRTLFRFKPLQQGFGNTDYMWGLGTFANTGSRNNDVQFWGFNMAPGGVPVIAGQHLWGQSMENWYELDGEVYVEYHKHFTDSTGTGYRPETWRLNITDVSDWKAAFYLSQFDIRYPGDDEPYFRTYLNGANPGLRIRDPVSLDGIQLYVDNGANVFYISNQGMENPVMYATSFHGSVFSRLYMTTPGDTPNTLVGRNTGSNQLGTVTPGNGLSLDGGYLNVFPTIINDYYVQSDSLCLAYSYIIGGSFNHDTLCISIDSVSLPQDSTFITGDSICVIDMGDTTCLTIGDLLDTHIGSNDLTLTANRTLNLNGKTFQITSPSSGSGLYLTVNSVQTSSRVQNLLSGPILKNTALFELSNTASTGTERPAFMRFKNHVYNFSQGILHESGAFVFSDSANLYNPVWRYHADGDTLSVLKRSSFYANVGIGRQSSATYALNLRGRMNVSNLANDGNIFINGGNGTATGTSNIVIGMSGAASGISTGTSNIILGGSGGSLSTGSYNILIGDFLAGGLGPSSKSRVIALGSYSGHGSTALDSSIFIGYRAGMVSSAGQPESIVIGNRAAEAASGGYRSVVIGTRAAFAGYNQTGGATNSVILGYEVARGQNLSNKLWIDNSDTIRPLIQGDFLNDTLRINGVLQVDGGTIVDEDGNPITGGGGGGDDWGSQVVEIDSTLTGDGTSGSVLGVKKRRSRDVSTELELDIRDYYVNVTGGSVTDTIFLPEVATASIDWSGLAVDQVGVGQTYVITNFRSAISVIVCAYNPAGSGSDDLIATQVQPGGTAGSAITIMPGESLTVESIRYASGIGYWRVSN